MQAKLHHVIILVTETEDFNIIFPITSNINHPSMLMAILNVEQARSSNVKRDQPNPKSASNWHMTEFF
jgi:hypothetical protein